MDLINMRRVVFTAGLDLGISETPILKIPAVRALHIRLRTCYLREGGSLLTDDPSCTKGPGDTGALCVYEIGGQRPAGAEKPPL
jgi:hypothetical protein